MVTYCYIKGRLEDDYDDFYDLVFTLLIVPFLLIFDFIFILFQPIFYLIVKITKKEE